MNVVAPPPRPCQRANGPLDSHDGSTIRIPGFGAGNTNRRTGVTAVADYFRRRRLEAGRLDRGAGRFGWTGWINQCASPDAHVYRWGTNGLQAGCARNNAKTMRGQEDPRNLVPAIAVATVGGIGGGPKAAGDSANLL